MKALVLSGGKGTRLRPLTYTSAKQLIPIANKPILFYVLEKIKEAKIEDVGIVVGETKKEILDAVKDGSDFGLKVTYIDQPEPLGLAHAVKIAQPYIKDAPFVMYLGDNILKESIEPFVKEFLDSKADSLILLSKVEHPERFGVAEFKNSKLVRLIEKPKNPPSDLALVGIYFFTNKIFEAVNNIKPSWRNEYEITDAIQYLIDKNCNIITRIVTDWWKDTGKVEDILEVNRLLLDTIQTEIKTTLENSRVEGRVKIEENTIIKNSIVRGPTVIGKNCQIIDSYIGPYTSIYHNTKIIKSEVEHSVILENATIENISKIYDSLIGQNTNILKADSKPTGYKVVIGDSSNIIIP